MASETRILQTIDRQIVSLRDYMRDNTHPVLCLGPMSQNIVDAVLRLANRLRRPIPLIASRRQIDCKEFGGGYVNSWDTRSFAQFCIERDDGYVPICRDHGGPWQGVGESDLSEVEAMARAKVSIAEDLAAGFDIIHIDPSVRGGAMTDPVILEKIFDLYAFVIETSRRLGRQVEIEVGAEQQSGAFSGPEELVIFLRDITRFCDKHNYQRPLFCVVQTGTLVREMRNVGLTDGRRNEGYDQKFAVDNVERTIKYLSDIAFINGVFIKEHNGDYLSDGSMALRGKCRVSGINIAPELGVYESKCLIALCSELGLTLEREQLLEIFYNSRKWEKWMSPDSTASDLDRALIAGHYTFSNPDFIETKARIAEAALVKDGVMLDEYLVESLMAYMRRLIWNSNYFNTLSVNNNESITAGHTISEIQGVFR